MAITKSIITLAKITFFKTFSRNSVVLRHFWSFLRLEYSIQVSQVSTTRPTLQGDKLAYIIPSL